MIWNRKIQKPEMGNLTLIEKEVFSFLIEHLPGNYGEQIINQLKYLKLIKRIEYNNDVVTELYPEKFGLIPGEILFDRKDEFRLAIIKFKINKETYLSEIYMVLGQLFDIKVKPKPLKYKGEINLELIDIKIEKILDKNS
jgi:hypothetical protein